MSTRCAAVRRRSQRPQRFDSIAQLVEVPWSSRCDQGIPAIDGSEPRAGEVLGAQRCISLGFQLCLFHDAPTLLEAGGETVDTLVRLADLPTMTVVCSSRLRPAFFQKSLSWRLFRLARASIFEVDPYMRTRRSSKRKHRPILLERGKCV